MSKEKILGFYDSSPEIDDFTQHFVDILCAEENMDSDYIDDQQYEELSDLLEKMIKANQKETWEAKLWRVLKSIVAYFANLLSKGHISASRLF